MRALIADDHPIFRAGLKEVLTKDPEVTSVGEAEDGHKALALARKARWDVVILDITLPGKDGIEVLHELRRERPKLPVLILSAHPEDQLALRLLRAGAAGYVTKDKAPGVLLTAIRKVLRGEKYISESWPVRAYASHAQVCLDIHDTGEGVPEGVQVFAPLVTTKPSGSGLGLCRAPDLAGPRRDYRIYKQEGRGNCLSSCFSDSP